MSSAVSVLLRSGPSASNRLLAALPPLELERIRPHLRPLELKHQTILLDAGDPVDALIFVDTGMVSIITVLSRSPTETAIVGREGIASISPILDMTISSQRALVQVPGTARALAVDVYRDLRRSCPSLELALRRFAFAVYSFTAQIAACNRRHDAAQRLARWLLLTQDRAESDLLPLTHEFMALMLGVRRSTVTTTAEELREEGLINYRRAAVEITDRKGLEARSCECYEAIREVYAVALD